MFEFLTTNEASQLSGYHPVHLRRLIRAGVIKASKKGRDWLIDRSSLLSYIAAQSIQGEKPGPKRKK